MNCILKKTLLSLFDCVAICIWIVTHNKVLGVNSFALVLDLNKNDENMRFKNFKLLISCCSSCSEVEQRQKSGDEAERNSCRGKCSSDSHCQSGPSIFVQHLFLTSWRTLGKTFISTNGERMASPKTLPTRITWEYQINSLPLQEPQEMLVYWCLPDLRPVAQCLASRELGGEFWSEIQCQEIPQGDLMGEIVNKWTTASCHA